MTSQRSFKWKNVSVSNTVTLLERSSAVGRFSLDFCGTAQTLLPAQRVFGGELQFPTFRIDSENQMADFGGKGEGGGGGQGREQDTIEGGRREDGIDLAPAPQRMAREIEQIEAVTKQLLETMKQSSTPVGAAHLDQTPLAYSTS